MDKNDEWEQERKPHDLTRGKTSGEGNTKVAIRIVRLPSVDVHAIRIEVTDVHELAIRGALPLHSAIRGTDDTRIFPVSPV